MKKLFYLSLLCMVFTSCRERVPAATVKLIDSLKIEIKSLETRNDSLELAIKELDKKNYWFDDEIEGRSLMVKGIGDPAVFIEESLEAKPELIPDKAILGGTMRFWKIQPLGSRWVIANYEDGHVAGRAIYGYTLKPDGNLEFKLLLKSEE